VPSDLEPLLVLPELLRRQTCAPRPCDERAVEIDLPSLIRTEGDALAEPLGEAPANRFEHGLRAERSEDRDGSMQAA
jgi:hypothetical protein